ncbi:hypothetical protein AB0E69_00885 [Kribbella sp. NPDC026611]|uniref:hypothetical protein n=1 Tax=Kribbella sp. NPDC026611 TaxID=3154911 RepID=UPI0033C8B2C4
MTARRRVGIGIWLVRAAAVLVLAGVATYLYAVGLDKADKLASALSLLVAVAVLLGPLFRRRTASPVEPEQLVEPVRGTAYLEDVRQLKPPVLLDREAELAQLAEFCASSESYWRWVADAWSGKTALLAWFVLHPPADCDVVSFFITTRFNPHNNRDAFIEAVTEQLDALLGSRPAYDDRAPIRTRHLQARLAEAAEHSRAAGRHLILVVDGLDEDRGTVVDAETYTIASLLPAEPVPGLKIIVAGRPHPPLPAEIGPSHPLRHAVHQLPASRHAQANEATAQRELRRLLDDPLGRRVLGLLVAAGGGLTATDLATLTQHPRDQVSRLIESLAGRTFITRPARWHADQHTLGLAHEELRQETLRTLDPSELANHRASLQTWSDEIAADGWPATTPEYLLRGHLSQLIEAGDLADAVALVTDDVRRERMLATTGGDHVARLEIAELSQALVAAERPNLSLLAQVALHREYVDARNSHLPTQLPALWVRLGDDDRALALARGLSSEHDRRSAMQALTAALLETGDERRLEWFVRSADDADQILRVLRRFLGDAAAAGDRTRVDRLAADALRWVPMATDELELRPLATTLAAVDDTLAAPVQDAIDSPYLKLVAAVGRVEAARARGDDALVARLTREADSVVELLQGYWLGNLLTELHPRAEDPGASEARLKQRDDEDPYAREVDELVAQPTDLDRLWELATRQSANRDLARQVGSLALALAWKSHTAAAEEFLNRLDDDKISQQVLADLTERVAQHGDLPRARALMTRLVEDEHRLAASPELARALLRAGDEAGAHGVVEEGRRVADRVLEGPTLTGRFADRVVYESMVRLADVCVELGRTDDAADLANLVQRSAAGMVEHPSGDGLRTLARALSEAGEAARAAVILPRLSADDVRRSLLTDVVRRLVEAGDDQLAEAVARRTADAETQLGLLVELVEARTRSGLDGRTLAEELCQPLVSSNESADVYQPVKRTRAVDALASGGDFEAAAELGGRILDPGLRRRALAEVCRLAAEAGRDDLAISLFEHLAPIMQPSVLTAMMSTAAGRGERDRADELAALALDSADALDTAGSRMTAWGQVGEAAIAAGLETRVHEVVDRLERTLAALVSEHDVAESWPSDGRDRARGLLVSLYLELGRWDDAELTYREMAAGLDRSEAMPLLARAAVEAGDTTLVERLIEVLVDPEENRWTGQPLAAELARRGEYRRALELTNGDTNRYVLGPIVEAAVRAGDFAFAEAVIDRRIPASDQVELWSVLIRTAGEPAQPVWFERAEEAVDRERTAENRARSLTRIADVADPPRARRLLAQAFVEGNWYEPVAAMAQVDHEQFREFADLVIGLVESRTRERGSGTLGGE